MRPVAMGEAMGEAMGGIGSRGEDRVASDGIAYVCRLLRGAGRWLTKSILSRTRRARGTTLSRIRSSVSEDQRSPATERGGHSGATEGRGHSGATEGW